MAGILEVSRQAPPAGAAPASTAQPEGLVPWRKVTATWWPLAFGLGLLILPTWIRYAFGIWQDDEYSHAPIVIGLALFLAWSRRDALRMAQPASSPLLALLLVAAGVLFYVPGAWIQSGFIESASQVLFVTGALACMGGPALVRRIALPLLLLLLAAPLPGNALGAATGALKQFVSQSAEGILYACGLPVARSGVIITVGTYRLLVADACSGMNSLFSLSAVGIFYLSLVQRSGWTPAILGLAIFPIAVLANVLRVMLLILITYYLGDEAGQGFLHDFAGFFMFLVALGTLALLDVVLGQIFRAPQGLEHARN